MNCCGRKKILVTGVCGFIFSNFIKSQLNNSKYTFVGVDKIVKDHNLENMIPETTHYKFYLADIADAHAMNRIFEIEKPDIVIGGAAESFVDNSITDILPFLHTNVLGTQILINCCLKYKARYLHISTDEVYGQQLHQYDFTPWNEETPLAPRNPYAASKAAAELIVRSAHETHGLQYQMTRSCNVFGPHQKHDNLIPHIIKGLLTNQNINIHGNGQNFRQYIYVQDKINAIMTILEEGEMNQVYNIGNSNVFSNLEMVEVISQMLCQTPKINFITDRKAHDFGYFVQVSKLSELGWLPQHDFHQSMKETIISYQRKLCSI